MKSLEAILRDRIFYIGNEIPAPEAGDHRAKFVLLGCPQDVIDEYDGENIRAPDPIAEKLAELLREILEPGVFGEPFLTNPDRVVANAIRDLCELRGYGNVMATAAALWSEKDPSGAISLAACNGVRKPVLKKIRDALAEYEKGKKP